ncbi:epoxide hydrolase family protein [Curtobacterium herbarum]|uniref:Epoxide hydrolase n=1 Tax=Curtobacterium herbarum TaxID=150122 RepID=A0ABN1ZDC5_9MICO|nr:epoxide hydrolase family protein [Curtobacterium herbarum]MBM7474270.1 pimeloyl-ACP methyl ester carboxylesterase [Curtobacterium herbarum]MCS6546091.1 alpha/beta fold hydrolase [Curtobacterium herbarum]
MSESARFDDATIEDLRARLRATRWPDAPAGTGWSLGVDVDELRELVTWWADTFDFGVHRAALDALPSRRADVGGIDVHLLHQRADREDALPLLLAHGWPDSGWRYRRALPDLVAAGFDVVVPDMPGYGFSATPSSLLDSRDVAGLWADLMTRLGYDRFAVAGGDIGSGVARWLAIDHPDRVVAVHRMDAGMPVYEGDPAELSAAERDFLAATEQWRTDEGAYAAMHRTKPQTAAVGLTDSPAGLAAWIVEKLRSWSDCDGDLWSVWSRDDVCALLTEYWVTGTIASSMRMYHANAAVPRSEQARRVEVPSGFTLFPVDLVRPPREWLERTTNLVSLSEASRGGHFAPVEQPERYVAEVVGFLDPFRQAGA